MTKQEFIELAQALLASGDVPNDIRARYNYNTVSGVLAEVSKTIFALDASFGDQMAKDVPLTLQKVGSKYFCELDTYPLNGSQGIRVVFSEDEKFRYYGRQGVTEDVIAGILGGASMPQWTLSGNKLFWSKKGGGWVTTGDEPTTFIAKVVLDIDKMDDDDYFVSKEYSEQILNKVVAYIRQNDVRPSERMNDTNQDAS